MKRETRKNKKKTKGKKKKIHTCALCFSVLQTRSGAHSRNVLLFRIRLCKRNQAVCTGVERTKKSRPTAIARLYTCSRASNKSDEKQTRILNIARFIYKCRALKHTHTHKSDAAAPFRLCTAVSPSAARKRKHSNNQQTCPLFT